MEGLERSNLMYFGILNPLGLLEVFFPLRASSWSDVAAVTSWLPAIEKWKDRAIVFYRIDCLPIASLHHVTARHAIRTFS